MSWQKLKELIHSVKPNEFEELVAKLLTSFLKIPFVVARSGDQPRGDAKSVSGDVSIQAKRYTGEKPPNAKVVEGDIGHARRGSSNLQTYVLAVSTDAEQLSHTLDSIAEETGLDIVTLELSDNLLDLGALCVTYWEEICLFFHPSDIDEVLSTWVIEMKDHSKTKKRLEELKPKLERGIQTQYHVKKDTDNFLLNRFSSNKGFNPINLSQAIDRQEIESKIDDWWESDSVPICYLQGEEGTGKTWLAAKWMNSIHQNDNCVAFWLDSKDWKGCESIFGLFNNCFSLIYPSYEHAKIKKLQNKPAKIWRKTLIILDGVNERDAIETAQCILNEYFRHNSEWKNKLRFLFTTRPLNDYPDFERDLWDQCHKIPVTPYNDPELQEVLSREGMQPHDLPDSLKEIAKFPRYFKRCIELKGKFGSYVAVTKEMILLADLQYKIEHSDSQIRENLGWTRIEDVKDFLSHLAQQIEWNRIENAPRVSAELLKKCFSNYTKTRIDLEEQRITRKTRQFHAELSEDHVLLCWALYLSTLFDYMEFTEVRDFAKGFQNTLEPIPSEDLRTEALFVALQISAIFPNLDISENQLSQKRAALMLAWFNSHNAQISKERISFWLEKDTAAYAQLVEAKFQDQISPNEEDAFIEPLAKIWRNKKGQLNDLASRLTKWLQPTYTDEIINRGDNNDPESLPFPTMYYTQTRLATAALSILSQRPERQFLSTLAKCHAIHEQIPQFNENIGTLIRWGYTETVLGDLYWLAELAKHDDFLSKGVYGLAAKLKQVNLPKPLQRPLSEENKKWREAAEQWNSTFKPFIDSICAKEKLLKDDSPDTNVNGNYHGLDYLAVRTDLPDLCDDDLDKIKEVLQHISENTKLGTAVGTTSEDNCIQNLMPWIAKHDAGGYAELACNLKINTLPQEWAQFKLLSIQGIIFKPEDCKRITEAILGIKEQLAQEEDFYSEVTWLTHLLTETLLFCASEENLKNWFIFLASQEPLRSSICYETLPYLFKYLLPTSIVELAQKKLEEHRDLSHENQNTSDQSSKEFSEEEYWCTLFAYASKVEDRTVKYALEDLKTRKPDSTGSFPMLRLAYSNPKLLLDETLIDENIQKHLFSDNGRRYTIRTYEGNDVPSYEFLRSFIPPGFIGSFLSGTDRYTDLSRWGKDFMKSVFSILNGNEGDSNPVKENQFGINREVFQAWAEQNQSDFLHLSDKYLAELSKSPQYQQVLSDITDVIHCLLLRFQPQKAEEIYQQWRSEIVRIYYYDQHGIESFLAQLWKVDQCNTPKHIELRRNLLEEYNNDEEVMFMTIAALTGGGKEELLNLVTQVYLNSHYAKVRNLGVSILPWFGSDEVIELLDKLKSDDHSLWVREHAAWAYEVAQQERSCRTVYREALQTRDLFQISAAFERMKPALSPTARWWPCQIEEDLGLNSELQAIDPKLIALVDRFWYRWGNSSKARRDIEIFGRKLKEYCRGEKNGYFSPPRLAPWWKPT